MNFVHVCMFYRLSQGKAGYTESQHYLYQQTYEHKITTRRCYDVFINGSIFMGNGKDIYILFLDFFLLFKGNFAKHFVLLRGYTYADGWLFVEQGFNFSYY